MVEISKQAAGKQLIKTAVTGEIGPVIADSFGVAVMNTLTAKFIGEKSGI